MKSRANLGCLGQLLTLFLGRRGQVEELPYRLRDDFLSPAELAFYRVLAQAAQDRAVICPKVNLGNLFFVLRGTPASRAHKNRIDRKHVDFVLCDPATMRPRMGIELDDQSHERQDRRERDEIVNEVFAVAGLPLARIPVRRQYSVAEITQSIAAAFAAAPPALPKEPTQEPICPKCGVSMVRRVARRGNQQGETFWGCRNYPQCRETAKAPSPPPAEKR